METIPLRPVFEHQLFQDSKPIVKYAVLNAVYLLCTQNKVEKPLPKSLEPYLGLCNPSYYRNKDVCRIILDDILPLIAKIKHLKYKSARKAQRGNVKRAIIRRELDNRKEIFYDENVSPEKFTPVSSLAKPYNPGAFDPIAIRNAKENNKTGNKRLFYDKPKD